MSGKDMRNSLKSLIISKLDKNWECSIDDKDTKERFIIKSYDGGSTYHLYKGCNLVIGDVPLQSVVESIACYHEVVVENTKNLYIGKWGGSIKAFIVDDLNMVPEGSRYVCSDDNMDIYESEEGVVFGVNSYS